MNQARIVSKKIEESLLQGFAQGLLVPHRFDPEDEQPYWSWPDAEAIIGPTNAFQDEEYLQDFIGQYVGYTYSVGGKEYRIQNAKITWPFISRDVHDMQPPHPSMTDEELMRYLWPGASMTESYCSTLWIDIGYNDDIFGPQIPTGEHSRHVIYRENWRKILQIPIQVGSNRCNLAKMRSYLDDPEWGPRARQFLEDIVHWESYIPDGYFIINGRLKRINISDKLMMNMAYVVRVTSAKDFGGSKFTPARERICEVRSVHPDIGLSYLQMFLVPPGIREMPVPKGVDADVFRFYNAPISVAVDRDFPAPVNIFDLVRGYGVIVMNHEDTKQAMNDLMAQIRLIANDDIEVIRASTVTRVMAGDQSKDSIISNYRARLGATHVALGSEDNEEIAIRLRRKILPHCQDDRDPVGTYWAKLRFLAMMIVDLMMAVTFKEGTNEPRKEATDRKDFAYKRWETTGHRLKDYVRMMLLPRASMVEGSEALIYKTIPLEQLERNDNKLLTYMQLNQWPAKFRPGGVFPSRKEDHKDGIVEDVPLHNIIAMIDSYRTVKIGAKGGPNTSASRRVHTSQWGFQCPVNTPENANIGLNNNLAEMALMSSDLLVRERQALEDLVTSLESIDPSVPGAHLLMVDGRPGNWVHKEAYWTLRQARRMGQINRGIGLAMHSLWPNLDIIVVRSTHGRPLLPLISLLPMQHDLTEDERVEAIHAKLDQVLDLENQFDPLDLETLFQDGIIEFVDGYELSLNVVVAGWLHKAMTSEGLGQYTHAMIKPGHLLSQATNCLPFLEHNPAPRGTYATQHIKQALARPFLHPEMRMDHGANYLEDPELPLIMTDTLKRLLNPRYHAGDEVDPRATGYGRNLNIACLSLDGNNDDGIHISEDVVASGIMDGQHYSILISDRNILLKSHETYDWVIDPDSGFEVVREGVEGMPQGLIDPDFSASVIVPYGDPYIVEVPDADFRRMPWINMNTLGYKGLYTYQLVPGELYIPYGHIRPLIVTYMDTTTNQIEERIVIHGKDPLNLPGKSIMAKKPGDLIHRMALAFVRQDKAGPLRSLHMERDQTLSLQDLKDGAYKDPIDIRFLNKKYPAFYIDPRRRSRVSIPIWRAIEPRSMERVDRWYGMGVTSIPKTLEPELHEYTWEGISLAIRPRRKVKRGDVGVRILRRGLNGAIVDEEKQRFEITYGVVDEVRRGPIINIRGLMPLFPKPGNKYGALHAQKSVCARIVPRDEMPKGRWFNEVLGHWEEFVPDIAFNPLSFPSRMTIGMIFEIILTGTIKYLWGLEAQGETFGTLFYYDPDAFEDEMETRYGPWNEITGESWIGLLDRLRDISTFMYNDLEKLKEIITLRVRLGIPGSSLYEMFLPGSRYERPLGEDVLQDLPSHERLTSQIQNPIFCGTIYYVALRHLVDNKRRARGYVGKRDPLTLQPVKGRKRNGGATTGVMESDAYKAHGASGMLYERMSRVSDHKTLLKCPTCGGIVVKNDTTGAYQCIDCAKTIGIAEANSIIEHETVYSWHLFSTYVRALGINITESFA